jgi:hypothetical protein
MVPPPALNETAAIFCRLFKISTDSFFCRSDLSCSAVPATVWNSTYSIGRYPYGDTSSINSTNPIGGEDLRKQYKK